jgi:23S rRNA pseudouridine1911/1915/1917 synthase
MVVAKTDAAHKGLAAQFADHGREGALKRKYLALVWGEPRPLKGVIETQIGRHPNNRLKMAVVKRDGKYAQTAYHVQKSLPERGKSGAEPIASLVECTLKTGRTHQIRIHLSHIGHPIIGDDVYGSGFRSKTRALRDKTQSAIVTLERQALHAAMLGFVHPIIEDYMQFESELPSDMRRILEAFT